MRDRGQGSRAVTVAQTTAGGTTTIITSPCRLLGWSLASVDVAGPTKTGTATAPAAFQQIAQVLAVPADEYTLNWQLQLSGTPGAGEVNNLGVFVGGTQVATSNNAGAAGAYLQDPIQIVVPAGGATVALKAIGAGTAGAVYDAQLSLTGGPAEATLLDGAQVVGTVNLAPQSSDTRGLPHDGIYVGTSVAISVNSGTVTGCVYVRDNIEDT